MLVDYIYYSLFTLVTAFHQKQSEEHPFGYHLYSWILFSLTAYTWLSTASIIIVDGLNLRESIYQHKYDKLMNISFIVLGFAATFIYLYSHKRKEQIIEKI